MQYIKYRLLYSKYLGTLGFLIVCGVKIVGGGVGKFSEI